MQQKQKQKHQRKQGQEAWRTHMHAVPGISSAHLPSLSEIHPNANVPATNSASPKGIMTSPISAGYLLRKHRRAARTLFRWLYLAHFCSFFLRFFAVFSVLTPGIQKVAPEDRGPVA